MDENAQRYLKRVKRALVCSRSDRERLLTQAGALLEDFAQENPGAFYKDYVASFGPPEEFAKEMLSNLGPEEVAEAKARRRRTVLGIAATAVIVLALAAGFWFGRSAPAKPAETTPTPTAETTPTPEPTETPEASPEPSESQEPGPSEKDCAAYLKDRYEDAHQITYKKAVACLLELKVLETDEEDTLFSPNGYVSRAEVAKMIVRMMYGGVEPILGVKPEPSYSDIKGHWAETYIEYCASLGILLGDREDGSLHPDEIITGNELARALLQMLGYDVNIYALTGSDWIVNTNTWANYSSAKLYDGISSFELDPNKNVNLDTAAQMFYNALKASPKVLEPAKNTNGIIEWVVVDATNDDRTPQTFLQKQFGLSSLDRVTLD